MSLAKLTIAALVSAALSGATIPAAHADSTPVVTVETISKSTQGGEVDLIPIAIVLLVGVAILASGKQTPG